MGSWRRVKQRGKPAIKQTNPLPMGEMKVFRYTIDDLIADERIKGENAIKLGEELAGLLLAYGDGPPRRWTQKMLRGLVYTLRHQGDFWDASAVQKYADARLQWAAAIETLKRARDNRHAEAEQIKPSYSTKATTTKNEYRPVSNGKWIGRVEPMPPSEPWHATTPPWEDNPTSEADTIPIRLTGNHSS